MDEPTQTNPPNQIETPKRNARWIFIGNNGIRSGWSTLLFVAIFIVLALLYFLVFGAFLKSHLSPKAPVAPFVSLFLEISQFALVLAATAVMALIEKRRIGVFGYSGNARAVRFCSGLVWGFIAISALIGLLWQLGFLSFDAGHLNGTQAWKNAAIWGLAFLFTGLFEESLLRGFLQFTLARGIGFWWGALLLSAIFGFVHKTNAGESPIGLFSAAAVGLVFCLSLWYTGSLWWAIGFHAAWDWGQTYFYGTSDSGMTAQGHLFSEHPTGPLLWSGGATGPEGSVLIIPLLVLMALAMWLWWGRRPAAWPVEKS